MVKELSFVFENTEVEMVTIDNEIMFEIYSTGVALGYITI